MFLDTGNSFLASRIHLRIILAKGRQQEGQRGANSLFSKITILGSIPMFLGTGNSFLASRIHFENYFVFLGGRGRYPPAHPTSPATSDFILSNTIWMLKMSLPCLKT